MGLNALPEPSSATFCFAAPPGIDAHLREAAEVYADTPAAEKILLHALSMDPQCLATHFSLYKFYFYKRLLREAEHVALLGLKAAARQGGFSEDWMQLDATSAAWSRVDGPQHFYLFTLKALAFIRLRLERADEAWQILAKLDEIDPADGTGASVIRDIAAASTSPESSQNQCFPVR